MCIRDSDIIMLKGEISRVLSTKNEFVPFKKVIDLSITPNRPDCLGVRGVARDLAAAGVGKLKNISNMKIKNSGTQKIKVSITKDKNQGCTIFGSCLIKDVTNKESPKWLKDKIISLGQKPISAIVDITNYVMLDLNRPLHAYAVSYTHLTLPTKRIV